MVGSMEIIAALVGALVCALFVFVYFLFLRQCFTCSCGWPGAPVVAQAVLELRFVAQAGLDSIFLPLLLQCVVFCYIN